MEPPHIPIINHYIPIMNHYIPIMNHYIPIINHYIPIMNHYIPIMNQYIPIMNQYIPIMNHYIPMDSAIIIHMYLEDFREGSTSERPDHGDAAEPGYRRPARQGAYTEAAASRGVRCWSFFLNRWWWIFWKQRFFFIFRMCFFVVFPFHFRISVDLQASFLALMEILKGWYCGYVGDEDWIICCRQG